MNFLPWKKIEEVLGSTKKSFLCALVWVGAVCGFWDSWNPFIENTCLFFLLFWILSTSMCVCGRVWRYADTHTQYAVPKRTFYTQPCVLSNTQSNTQWQHVCTWHYYMSMCIFKMYAITWTCTYTHTHTHIYIKYTVYIYIHLCVYW